jgi:hypothetical protein
MDHSNQLKSIRFTPSSKANLNNLIKPSSNWSFPCAFVRWATKPIGLSPKDIPAVRRAQLPMKTSAFRT